MHTVFVTYLGLTVVLVGAFFLLVLVQKAVRRVRGAVRGLHPHERRRIDVPVVYDRRTAVGA